MSSATESLRDEYRGWLDQIEQAPEPPTRKTARDLTDSYTIFVQADGRELAQELELASTATAARAATAEHRLGLAVGLGLLFTAAALALGWANRRHPPPPSELFAGKRRLTDVSRSFRNEISLSEPEPFVAVAPDGARIDAWVMRPVDFDEEQTYPTVLNVHGGPFTQYGQRFFDEFQVEAGAGSVVVYANPRGSSGYAEEWGRAIRGPVEGGPGWGSVDYDDLMAVVDEAVKRYPFIDADRLAVMGGSYGGYMTSWIVGHTDRFRCAISERAVNEMASEDGTSDLAGFFRGYVGASAWDAPEAYARISPLSYAAEMTTPLLILHSEEDLRCPINQGEQLFTVLRSMRRPVELVRFPAESHELTRSGSPTHRVQRFEIVLEFLDRHLRESASR